MHPAVRARVPHHHLVLYLLSSRLGDPHSSPDPIPSKKRTTLHRRPPRAAAAPAGKPTLLASPPGAVHRFQRPCIAARVGLTGLPIGPLPRSAFATVGPRRRPADPARSARISCSAAATAATGTRSKVRAPRMAPALLRACSFQPLRSVAHSHTPGNE
jgi:hypothetical protein